MFGGGGLFEFVYSMDRWKKLLRKEIIKRFPKEDFTKYVEVFGGAGWVLISIHLMLLLNKTIRTLQNTRL